MTLVLGRYKTTILRQHVNKCLREFCGPLNATSVLNLGAKPNDPDKEGSKYEDYFPGATFKTFDLEAHDHERHIHGDLMDPPTGIGTFDLVITNSVIEHIDRPWKAAPHISSLIRPGGHLFIAMPWFYPVHEGPYFGDHWRSTPSGMEFLFEDLRTVKVDHSPSSIVVVKDRKRYWNKPNSTYAGFCMLMEKAT